MARPSPDQRGVALVSVLLLVAGLIAIATAVVTLSASQRRAAQRAEEADARKATLDAALRIVLAEIAFPKVDGPFWYPRQPRTLKVAGKPIEVTLEREAGRIDLNTAEERYLVAGLVAGGLEEPEARAGAARIRDWTDADDERRPDGAEREDYVVAAMNYEPRNGPFESTEELRQVLGMHKLDDDALQAFTVYSQTLAPSAGDAPPATRRALDWLDKSAGEGGSNVPANAPTEPLQSVSYAGSVVRLRACEQDVEVPRCRETVQRLTGNARQPFLSMSWQ